MKKLTFLLLLLFIAAVYNIRAEEITLRFSANHTCAYAQLDSIRLVNLTQGGATMLYYPDTVWKNIPTWINSMDGSLSDLYLSQNYPNPFSGETSIKLGVPDHGVFQLSVYDLSGRKLVSLEFELDQGMHLFRFFACDRPAYILKVQSKDHSQQQIMIQSGGRRKGTPRISYLGESFDDKTGEAHSDKSFSFEPGDELRFVGFTMGDQAVIEDDPREDTDYVFEINSDIPAQPSEISGEELVIAEETGLVYEVDRVEGMVYEWDFPFGWEVTDGHGTHSVEVTAGTFPGDITVTANNNCGSSEASIFEVFVQYALTLEVNPEEGGTVHGGGVYNAGQEVTAAATPNAGYLFVNWTNAAGAEVSSNPQHTFFMPGNNIFLTANFNELPDGDDDGDPGEGAVDIDGNQYTSIYIGGQEWTVENLRATRYNNGDDIITGLSNADWSNTLDGEIGAYAVYPHDNVDGINSEQEMIQHYGKLYNWFAAIDERGLCPEGWRVPSDEDWSQLTDYLVNQYTEVTENNIGLYLRSCRQVNSPYGDDCMTNEHPRWNADLNENVAGTDEFNFSIFPSGARLKVGSYQGLGGAGYYWTTTQFFGPPLHLGYSRAFFLDSQNISASGHNKEAGFGIRCVRDVE